MSKAQAELRLIRQSDSVIDADAELRVACKKILTNLRKATKAARGAILSLNPTDKTPLVLVKSGNLDQKLIRKCLSKKQTVHSQAGGICMPIRIHGVMYGLIYLADLKGPKGVQSFVGDIESILDGRFKHEFDSFGIKKIFSRYVGSAVMEKVLSHPEAEMLTGQSHNVSILFADVNGFTAYSNKHAPEWVIGFLNDFFETMCPLILKNKGTIDKFIGDEIMAVFGAPLPMKGHAKVAVKTALQMIKRARPLLRRHKIPQGGLSVGIATGHVISGNIGFEQMTDYTVIGRKVNLAARLTSLAGRNEIYVDDATKLAAPNHKFASLGHKPIKGFTEMPVFKVKT